MIDIILLKLEEVMPKEMFFLKF